MDSLLSIFGDCGVEDLHDDATIEWSETLLADAGTILPPEREQGNVEYKLKLINPTPNRLEHLISQMKWRLQEGNGVAIYEIGVEDNGDLKGLSPDEIQASLHTLHLMADKINASVTIIQEKTIGSTKNDNINGSRKVLEVSVKRIPQDKQTEELRISVLGNVDSGKSSLLGVLTQGELDNGKGRARLNLFRHRHEIRTGRTSSINKEILGFDSRGKPITYCDYQTSDEICDKSSKIIVFVDSGGHPKYLKTTVFSLTATHADYAILVVNCLSPIDAGTNLLHLSLALALEVPVIVVLNKIDLCDISTLDNILGDIESLVRSPFGKNKTPLTIHCREDIQTYQSACRSKVVPIFLISCVTGEGLDLLYQFLHLLEPSLDSKHQERLTKQNTIFQIDQTFNITKLGIVASGFLSSGLIEEGAILKAGPLPDGNFIDVHVSSVQRHKVSRRFVRPGESSTLALEIIPDGTAHEYEQMYLSKILRKGMVLLSTVDPDSICHYFQAQIFSMPHSGVIVFGSTATIYIENVRQSVVIVAIMDKENIRENESATVIIRFLSRPEYIRHGYRFLVQQQQRTRAIGHVTKVFF